MPLVIGKILTHWFRTIVELSRVNEKGLLPYATTYFDFSGARWYFEYQR